MGARYDGCSAQALGTYWIRRWSPRTAWRRRWDVRAHEGRGEEGTQQLEVGHKAATIWVHAGISTRPILAWVFSL